MVSDSLWLNQPLQEAVFDLRFSTLNDYSIFAGVISELQRDKFKVERMISEDLPVRLPGMIRHRFFNSDKSLFFQTGQDVISVNSVSYSGFHDFLKQIESILELPISRYPEISTLFRLGLTYINKFDNVNDMYSVLSLVPPSNNNDFELVESSSLQLSYSKKEENNIFLSKDITFDFSRSNLMFVINAHEDFPNGSSWDLPSILIWINDAHTLISESFNSLVSKSEKKRRNNNDL